MTQNDGAGPNIQSAWTYLNFESSFNMPKDRKTGITHETNSQEPQNEDFKNPKSPLKRLETLSSINKNKKIRVENIGSFFDN
jgi:hypothetical protein